MVLTVTTTGPTFEQLTRDTARDLKKANRKAGKAMGKVGAAAMKKGAPRMWGRVLGVRYEANAWPTRCDVEFLPAPRTAGGWGIQEGGARPHEIEPRKRRALHFSGLYSASAGHPGAGGRQAWTKAGQRMLKAVDKTVHDVYDEALDA